MIPLAHPVPSCGDLDGAVIGLLRATAAAQNVHVGQERLVDVGPVQSGQNEPRIDLSGAHQVGDHAADLVLVVQRLAVRREPPSLADPQVHQLGLLARDGSLVRLGDLFTDLHQALQLRRLGGGRAFGHVIQYGQRYSSVLAEGSRTGQLIKRVGMVPT